MKSAEFDLDPLFAEYPAICGIDEAGRGCLAGPVVVAAVTWSPQALHEKSWFPELGDSKCLSPRQRAALLPHIFKAAHRIRTAVINPHLIDHLNILKASLHGFEMVAPAYDPTIPLVIDGNHRPASLKWAKPVVKGDQKLSSVAAAGIVAKEIRDHLMRDLAARMPNYGFEVHKGYATQNHRRAIETLGPCRYHRKSFRPVRDAMEAPKSIDQLFLDRIRSSEWENLRTLWHEFHDNYHLFSLPGAQQIINTFQEKGMAILPSARDFETTKRTIKQGE